MTDYRKVVPTEKGLKAEAEEREEKTRGQIDELREDEHWAEITKRSDEQDLINARSF